MILFALNFIRVLREGNSVVDVFANHGVSRRYDFTAWL
jgi:hypothetical protein